MMSNSKKVEMYILSKRHSWAPKTIENARSMLMAYGAGVLTLTPAEFYDSLAPLGDYSKKTLFIIAAGYYGFVFPETPNTYAAFRKENRNVFKHAYKKKALGKSYDEVKAAITAHPDDAFRTKALSLLSSAQRWTESHSGTYEGGNGVQGDGREVAGTITGKGGKQRPNFAPAGNAEAFPISYVTFRRRLKECCGIAPHALRKLALTRAASRGATAADLCAIAGWSSIATAFTYLQPQETARLKSFLE